MHWYDYGAVLLAMVLALIAGKESKFALRAAVAVYVRDESKLRDWVRTFELRTVFGPFVYDALRDLVKDKLLERKDTPGDVDVRGPYPNVWYRWKGPPK